MDLIDRFVAILVNGMGRFVSGASPDTKTTRTSPALFDSQMIAHPQLRVRADFAACIISEKENFINAAGPQNLFGLKLRRNYVCRKELR
jgi:hypothetical protein